MLNRYFTGLGIGLLCIGLTAPSCGRDRENKANTSTIDGEPTNSTSTECQSPEDCPGDEFCHFPQGTSYNLETPGECSPPCTTDNNCHIGQQCINGICYSNYDCTPGNNNCDCPRGEVCTGQTNTCNAPPSTCFFVEQCPCEWICNADNTCVNPVDLGACTDDAACNSIAGCENNGCVCTNGACQPIGMCTSAEDCPDGTYCQNGVCQQATTCTNDNDCLAYGLVCENGYCVNPPPCSSDTDCPQEEWCNISVTPPGCFPDEFGGCVRDDQCPGGQYCNLFSGTCEEGCRNNTDCVNQCPQASICSCNAMHQCVEGALESATCDDNIQCPGGTVCAPTSANDVNCLGPLEGLLGACEKSCLRVCDVLMSQISAQCPVGETCQTPGGIIGAITELVGGGNGQQSTTVGVCYPQ